MNIGIEREIWSHTCYKVRRNLELKNNKNENPDILSYKIIYKYVYVRLFYTVVILNYSTCESAL